ncbi:hypothetical protein Belba_2832 [Belliella baltica DSM 15883]|jgi:hypothetical protein|uniref:Uncharacterized protein n=1 Tax=Belliella baltica (strain DSM 15883 / CIP 108006 / LMG 21964 / BA134) TaxID=866536 RepID=I3Z7Z7_BELBD|nr:hypothetical protein Belba_2832 [Belliella baltica DSM 15883]
MAKGWGGKIKLDFSPAIARYFFIFRKEGNFLIQFFGVGNKHTLYAALVRG